MKKIALLLVLCSFFPLRAQTFQESQTLNNQIKGSYFGHGVDAFEDFLIVGAPHEGGTQPSYKGAAYIYKKDTNGDWKLVQRLTSPNISTISFGKTTSINRNYALVGDIGGIVYVYKRNSNNTWSLSQSLQQTYGQVVSHEHTEYTAISENWLVVGYSGYGNLNSPELYKSGAAHVYKKNLAGKWEYYQKIRPSTPSVKGNFGINTSISDNHLLVRDQNAVYVFARNVLNQWQETQKLDIESPRNTLGDAPIRVLGNTALIGVNDFQQHAEEGVVYVYNYNPFTQTWSQTQVLKAFDTNGVKDRAFGYAIDISDKYIAVGTSVIGDSKNASYVFKKTSSNTWVPEKRIITSDTGNFYLGNSVAVTGDDIICGAEMHDGSNDPYYNSGQVYIFKPTATCDLVNIPDRNFEQALLDANVDTDGVLNGTICRRDAEAQTVLYISGKNIMDMTGIEAFKNIKRLYCRNNEITSLDLSGNIKLTLLDARQSNIKNIEIRNCSRLEELVLGNNDINQIDLSQNRQLKIIELPYNELSSINVSNNKELKELLLGNNSLENLNLSYNLKLEMLTVFRNKLRDLDLSNNRVLQFLWCFSNSFTSLDLSNNIDLHTLDCSGNSLTGLDVSNNENLRDLSCSRNSITNLDLSENKNLERLRCSDNALTSLNIRNGANTQLGFIQTFRNPDLTCIQVDNVDFANSQTQNGNWEKDNSTVYKTNCSSAGIVTGLRCSFFKNKFTMSWDPLPNVKTYHIQVIWNNVGTTSDYFLPGIATSYSINTLANSGKWRIKPTNGEWSSWVQNCLSPFIYFKENQSDNSFLLNKEPIIHPNPSTDGRFYLETVGEIKSLTIFDLKGKVVYKNHDVSNSIELFDLNKGVYIARIAMGNKIVSKKLIIQ